MQRHSVDRLATLVEPETSGSSLQISLFLIVPQPPPKLRTPNRWLLAPLLGDFYAP